MNAQGGRNRLSHERAYYLVIQNNASLKTYIQAALYRNIILCKFILYGSSRLCLGICIMHIYYVCIMHIYS